MWSWRSLPHSILTEAVEIVARPCQVLYIFRCKSCEFHISVRDFWRQNTCEGTGQLLHASRASLEGVREAEQTQLGCPAHMCCDYESGLWHKHHKVSLWMTIRDKWPFFPGIPWLLLLHLRVRMSRSSLASDQKTHSGRWCLEDISNGRSCGYVIVQARRLSCFHLGIARNLSCYWQMLLRCHTCYFMKGCLIF